MDFVSLCLISEFILIKGLQVSCELWMHIDGGTVCFETFIGGHSLLYHTDSVSEVFRWYTGMKKRAAWGPVAGRYLFRSREDYELAIEVGEASIAYLLPFEEDPEDRNLIRREFRKRDCRMRHSRFFSILLLTIC